MYSPPYASFSNSTTTIVFPRLIETKLKTCVIIFYSFSEALGRKGSTEEKQENDNEEGRKRRKAEDLERLEKRTTTIKDWDYRVLSPHLSLQDIHAFTESGLKDNSL